MIDQSRDEIPTDFMISLQRILWWIIFGWFLAASTIGVFKTQLAVDLSFVGVILIIIMTILRIIAVSVIMKKVGRGQDSLIGYLLLVVLASTVLIKYFTR